MQFFKSNYFIPIVLYLVRLVNRKRKWGEGNGKGNRFLGRVMKTVI